MRTSILSLQQEYDEEWRPLDQNDYDSLKEVIIEESLFLGSEGEKALNVYLNFLGQAVYFLGEPRPDDRTLRNIYQFLDFISDRIREYFRKRIGLSSEGNPLLDIYLIAACYLVTKHCRFINDLSHDHIEFDLDIDPSALADKLMKNLNTLRSELTKLATSIESDNERKKLLFRTLSEVRYYTKLFDNK